MEKTPQSSRAHISIFGQTNSGKSALFNALLGSNTSIVSGVSGTTTDPVSKAMELLPYGPVVLTDTAGLNDSSELGKARAAKTTAMLERTDYALYAADIDDFDRDRLDEMTREFARLGIPYKLVFTKSDIRGGLEPMLDEFSGSVCVSVNDADSITELKFAISTELSRLMSERASLIGGLLPPGAVVVMVVPIDSEAPAGRLILPQVQLIRDCLDHGIRANITGPDELEQCLRESGRVDLVVTDSQAFNTVSAIVPESVRLTSFSILTARSKCGLNEILEGIAAIDTLRDGDRVLIAEVCTHSHSHDDIGRVKIPAALKKLTGKDLAIDFAVGRDYPELSGYKLIVHCGGCMVTSREMKNRIRKASEFGVAVTNYGLLLAHAAGALKRSVVGLC